MQILRCFSSCRDEPASFVYLAVWCGMPTRRRADPPTRFCWGLTSKARPRGSDAASPYLRRGAERRPAEPPTRFFLLGVDLKGEATQKAPAQTELRPTCAVARYADTPTRRHADPFLLGVDLKGEATRKAPAQTELRPTCAVARNADTPSRRPADPFLLGSDLKGEATRKASAETEFRPTCAVAARHAMTLLGRVVRYADPPTRRPADPTRRPVSPGG